MCVLRSTQPEKTGLTHFILLVMIWKSYEKSQAEEILLVLGKKKKKEREPF